MPYAKAKGANLYYESAGRGYPVVFVHEFAGDLRSWESQVRYFSRRYRCIAFNARGFPPSDVPQDVRLYGQDIATDDVAAVMRHIGIKKAHVVGLSMGGFAALHFAIRYPRMASCVVVAGCGYGAPKGERKKFQSEVLAVAQRFETEGMAAVANDYGSGPTRVQYQNKDPRGFAEFKRQFAEHSDKGSGLTMRAVQCKRPSIYDLRAKLQKIKVPTLLVTGDEDEPCLDANIYMKRMIPTAGLVVVPRTGHLVNLEEPAIFNNALQEFFASVEQRRWAQRDPRSLSKEMLTTDDQRRAARRRRAES